MLKRLIWIPMGATGATGVGGAVTAVTAGIASTARTVRGACAAVTPRSAWGAPVAVGALDARAAGIRPALSIKEVNHASHSH